MKSLPPCDYYFEHIDPFTGELDRFESAVPCIVISDFIEFAVGEPIRRTSYALGQDGQRIVFANNSKITQDDFDFGILVKHGSV